MPGSYAFSPGACCQFSLDLYIGPGAILVRTGAGNTPAVLFRRVYLTPVAVLGLMALSLARARRPGKTAKMKHFRIKISVRTSLAMIEINPGGLSRQTYLFVLIGPNDLSSDISIHN